MSLAVPLAAIAGAFPPVPCLLDVAHAIMLALMSPLEWLAELPLAMLEKPCAGRVDRDCGRSPAARGCSRRAETPLRLAGRVWMAPMFAVAAAPPAPGEAWLDVLDVGNGLAVVVRTAHHALVYDTGPGWNADVIVAIASWCRSCEARGFAPSTAWWSRMRTTTTRAERSRSRHRARPRGSFRPFAMTTSIHTAFRQSVRCESGPALDVGRGGVLDAASAGGYVMRRRARRKENDRGCVLKVSTARASALLAGDVESRAEAEMLARDAQALRAEVLPRSPSRIEDFLHALFIAGRDAAGRDLLRGLPQSLQSSQRGRRPSAMPPPARSFARTDREGALHIELPARRRDAVAVRAYA